MNWPRTSIGLPELHPILYLIFVANSPLGLDRLSGPGPSFKPFCPPRTQQLFYCFSIACRDQKLIPVGTLGPAGIQRGMGCAVGAWRESAFFKQAGKLLPCHMCQDYWTEHVTWSELYDFLILNARGWVQVIWRTTSFTIYENNTLNLAGKFILILKPWKREMDMFWCDIPVSKL